MTFKEELLFDFSINLPRVLVSGNMAIIDNVKRIVVFSDTQIIVHNGRKYTCAEGKGLGIRALQDGRMTITGELEQIRFLGTL